MCVGVVGIVKRMGMGAGIRLIWLMWLTAGHWKKMQLMIVMNMKVEPVIFRDDLACMHILERRQDGLHIKRGWDHCWGNRDSRDLQSALSCEDTEGLVVQAASSYWKIMPKEGGKKCRVRGMKRWMTKTELKAALCSFGTVSQAVLGCGLATLLLKPNQEQNDQAVKKNEDEANQRGSCIFSPRPQLPQKNWGVAQSPMPIAHTLVPKQTAACQFWKQTLVCIQPIASDNQPICALILGWAISMAKGIEDFPEGWECDQSLSDEIIKSLQLKWSLSGWGHAMKVQRDSYFQGMGLESSSSAAYVQPRGMIVASEVIQQDWPSSEHKDDDDEAYELDIATDGTSADEKEDSKHNHEAKTAKVQSRDIKRHIRHCLAKACNNAYSTPFNFKDIANSLKPKIKPKVLQGPVENLLKQGYVLIDGSEPAMGL
ncbi:hypothetical protein BS47DRAFT_1361004 [Hydnum rufescens UP504]|uniref:Uncharacterized protein n=1 Tax=Hydnum rufescens UP504 TaxID=1448309 RepID=A0A9P6B0W9_9AGAM|nr:hypothetical protein BS47DRAFT_1361004 [Hydnum rufescens UP504]